jgi:RNA polymerase sigma-70 factor (ECF subfamily)
VSARAELWPATPRISEGMPLPATGPSTSGPAFPSNQAGHVRRADLDLAERCRAGAPGAFEELYRQHAAKLYNLAFRMADTPQDAEDLLQDVFLLAHRKLGSYRGEASLGTWLYRLAMNHCLDVLRNRQTRMGQRTESLDEPDAPEPSSPVPLATVHRIDLERAIGTLPPACRAAFLLHDVEGFGHQEVGTILGVSEGTSKSQVHKARMRIRAYLAGNVAAPSAATREARED